MYNNAESLVMIDLVLGEIFGGICRFLPFCPKRCSFCPRYWTDLDHIYTVYAAKILPFNMCKYELWYSNPFWNASMLNEGNFANFSQNGYHAWQRLLRNRKMMSVSIKFTPVTFGEKNCENRSGGYWNNLAQFKKKEINASKIYAWSASLPSVLNKKLVIFHPFLQ